MQVEICNNCEGRGSFLVNEYREGYNERKCKKCAGTGRLLTRVYKVEIPFGKQKERSFIETDSTIINEIQKLKTQLQ